MALPQNVLFPLETLLDIGYYLNEKDDDEALRLSLIIEDKVRKILERERYKQEKGYQ